MSSSGVRPAIYALELQLGIAPGDDLLPANRARRQIEKTLGRLHWEARGAFLRARAYWRGPEFPRLAVANYVAREAWVAGFRPVTITVIDQPSQARETFSYERADYERIVAHMPSRAA